MKIGSVAFALLALGPAVTGCAAGADAPPAAQADPAEDEAILALGERGRIGGVAVTVLRIEEDSRCPTDVQCVQAGTVRVVVRLEEDNVRRDAVLTLARPLGIDDGRWLTLATVCPYPRQPGTIGPADYRFTFVLGSDGAAAPRDAACAR